MNTITVDVFDWEKKKCGEIQLNTFVFQQEPRLDIISELVRAGQGGKRQGSHNVKTRAEVRGGGAKPFRQKGTGRARQGSSRSPLLRSGGVTHGPKPRKYSKKIGAKVRKLGIRSTLSYLFSKGVFVVVEDMVSKEGKTKDLQKKLKKFSSKSLLVDYEKNLLFSRACRNLSSYQLLSARGLNVYDLLKYNYVICTRNAVEKIHDIYGGLDSELSKKLSGESTAKNTEQRNKSEVVQRQPKPQSQKHKTDKIKEV